MRFLYLLLVFAPLPFASARPGWQWFWALFVTAIAVGIAFQGPRKHFREDIKSIALPVLATSILIIWGCIQSLMGISGNPEASLRVSMFTLSYLLWFLIVLDKLESKKDVHQLVLIIAVVGTAYAIYGLWVFFEGNEYILWYKKFAYESALTSTFVNRNSFAAFCGLSLQAAFAYFLWLIYGVRSGKFSWHAVGFQTQGIYLVISILLLVSALLLTSSRAGVFTTFAGVVTLLLLVPVRVRNGVSKPRWQKLKVIGVVMATLLMLLLLSGSGFMERAANGFLDDYRFVIYPQVVEAILDKPMLGHGMGTFEYVFRSYRTPEMISGTITVRAHSDFLELVLTAGIPVSIVFLVGMSSAALLLLKQITVRVPEWPFVIMGLAVLFQIGLHSVVDFSLQIPAVTYTFLALLAAAVRATLICQKELCKERSSSPHEA